MLSVRSEQPRDRTQVFEVNRAAFGRPDEALLVDRLRETAGVLISLVAVEADQVVGHILFTPVQVASETPFDAMALGPMAVLPGYQRRGIGSRLVRSGLDACREAGHSVVFVLGHPRFYPRFGFTPAGAVGIAWEHPAPEDAFMVIELTPGALGGRTGIVKYLPEFTAV
jgi:putative acetyltransferase